MYRVFWKFLSVLVIIALFFTALGVIPVLPEREAKADEYDVLRVKWKNYLTGANLYSLPVTDSDLADRISSITSSAQGYWDSMIKTPGRTYLWADNITSTDSSHIYTNYSRLYTMALAYSTKGSSLENNATLISDIKSGLDWVYTNQYNENLTWQVNTHTWEISVPTALCNTVTMIYEQLSSTQITNYMNAVNAFCNDPTNYSTSTNVSYGTNRVWESIPIAIRGIIIKSSSRITLARDNLSASDAQIFDYTQSTNGWYRDGSYVYHDRHPYNGGYGLGLYTSLIQLKYLLHGSSWQFNDPRDVNIFDWTANSYIPIVQKGRIMYSTMGRNIAIPTVSDHSQGRSLIKAMLTLIDAASPEDAAYYKSVVKYWILNDTYQDYLTYAQITQLIQAKNILNDASITAAQPNSFRMYAGMDRAVQQRPEYAFGVSMYSNRIYDFETVNHENKRGWYISSGMFYLYDNDLTQYNGNYWPTIDPKRLPGITVDAGLTIADEDDNNLSSKSWVGGVELAGLYGTSGMELDGYNSTLAAKKSWFMFDDEIVFLGSGISSTDGRTIETIIDNKKLNSSGNNTLTVNGTAKSSSLGWSETMSGVNWAHLQGNVTGSDVGYYFPSPTSVKGLRQQRSGAWSDINSDASSTSVTSNYLTLWLDHGVNPSAQTYSYVMLPGKTSSQVSSYSANPNISVLSTSTYVHAVKENTLNIVAANFWTDVKRTIDIITCDKKASVMTKENNNELEISVADPTQENKGIIEVEIARSATGIISKDPEIVVNQLSPTVKLSVQVNGSLGMTKKIKLSTGTPPQEPEKVMYLPTADSAIRSGTYANTNYGSDTEISIRDSVNVDYVKKDYMKFDLSSVNTVSSAKLKVYGSTATKEIDTLSALGCSTDTWTEGGITWNNAPLPEPKIYDTIYVNGMEQYYELDVTEFIQQQIAGDNIATLVLTGNDFEEDSINIKSRENSAYQQRLEIVGTFTSPPEQPSDPPQDPAKNQVMLEDFDSYTVGNAPTGWTVDNSGGSAQVYQFSGSSVDKELRLVDSSTSKQVSAEKAFSTSSGLVSVEYKVRAVQNNQTAGAAYLYDSSGSTATSVTFGSDGQIDAYDSGTSIPIMAYDVDKWYKIRLEINTVTDSYDVYVDEVKRASGIRLRAQVDNIAKLKFFFSTSPVGTMYVDDVRVSAAAVPTPTYTVNDSFNSDTTGSAPTGWTTDTSGGTVTVAAIPSTSDKSVKILDSSATYSTAAEKTFTPQKGTVTIEYKVRAEQTTALAGSPYIYDSNGDNATCVLMGSNGYIRAYDGQTVLDLQTYTSGTWYTVKLVLNTDNDTYNIYINDVIKGWGLAFRYSAIDISKVKYFFSTSTTGTVYFDNVKVY